MKFEKKFMLFDLLYKKFADLLGTIDGRLEDVFIKLYNIMIDFIKNYSENLGNKSSFLNSYFLFFPILLIFPILSIFPIFPIFPLIMFLQINK